MQAGLHNLFHRLEPEERPVLISSIRLDNFLSFGATSETVTLGPLNLLIGPNGSGKSNLLEAFELLRSTPQDLSRSIRDGGGVRDWLWKGSTAPTPASIEVVVSNPKGAQDLRYRLAFAEVGQRFEIVDECIENKGAESGYPQPYFYYQFRNGRGVLNVNKTKRSLQREDIESAQSILAQRRDPDQYPEITYLGQALGKMRLYREWSFGRYTAPRLPQKADLPNHALEPDCSNLGLVLNSLRRDPTLKARLLKALQALYQGIDDYEVHIEGGTVQVFFHEGRHAIPATRLSDGTLRYLCLLAILCHPAPPPLVCIEEPELGLHPDVLPVVAELLKEASTRSQLIVTTHSDVLVDAMTDTPEAVLIAEKPVTGTTLRRLDAETLKPWLESYRLGELWTRGDIGGLRW
jgi:predicted ATPase